MLALHEETSRRASARGARRRLRRTRPRGPGALLVTRMKRLTGELFGERAAVQNVHSAQRGLAGAITMADTTEGGLGKSRPRVSGLRDGLVVGETHF